MNSALCVQCDKWIHSRHCGVKRATQRFSGMFACYKCDNNIGEAVEQEEKLYNRVEMITYLARYLKFRYLEFIYLGDRVIASGEWEATVAAITTCVRLCLGNVTSCCMKRGIT